MESQRLLGEAQRLAKCELINSSSDLTPNKLQYSLLGDPALSLNLPRLQVKVESINGKVPDALGSVVLKGGSVVTVKGHIYKGGEKQTSLMACLLLS